jgi:hypothetical protein
MQLDLNAQELEELEDVLANSLGGLREEVYKAEVAAFKDRLHQREAVLSSLLQRIRGLRTAGTP